MKQHITWEQLKECNVLKLRRLINDEVFNDLVLYYLDKSTEAQREYFINKIIEYLNIGKMIEIIANKGYYFHIEEAGITIFDENKDEYVGFGNENIAIADALWEAVKYILGVENE